MADIKSLPLPLALDSEEVPPLEDMSKLLQKVNNLQEFQKKAMAQCKIKSPIEEGNVPEVKMDKDSVTQEKSSTRIQQCRTTHRKDDTFCGFKKGFLLAPQNKNTKHSETNATKGRQKCDITEIKPKKDYKKDESLAMPEVQQALNASQAFLHNKDWITKDLLQNVEDNKDLCNKLTNPKFMKAIAEFQTNPEAAMIKYQSDTEIQKCFMDFCGIMGEHFSRLGDTTEKANEANSSVKTAKDDELQMKVLSSTNPKQATADDEERMETILARSDVTSVLMKPSVAALMAALRNDPGHAQRLLLRSDDTMKKDIRLLIDVGLLQFKM